MTDTNKMREEFEAYIEGKRMGVSLSRNPDDAPYFSGHYRDERVHWAWTAWQASRQAVVVELPCTSWGDPYAHGWNEMHGKAVAAIEAQGLRVGVRT